MERLVPLGVRERNAAQTRRAILDAARQLFTRKGYAGTTVHSIAESLGITDPAVYYYFHSKRELWQAAVDDVSVPTPPHQGIGTAEELAQWLLDFFLAYVRHADSAAMLLREQLGADPASANYREQTEGLYSRLAGEMLQRLYGEQAELLLRTLTTMLSGMFWDGILTFGPSFSSMTEDAQFRDRIYRAIALPLGLPRVPRPSSDDEPLMVASPVETAARSSLPAVIHRGRDTTRARILHAAMELFSMNGVDGTSVRAIAERCGLTDPAVYYYFPSKAALLDCLWDDQRDYPHDHATGTEPLDMEGLASIVDELIESSAAMDAQLRLLIRQVLSGDNVALSMRNDAGAQWRAYLSARLAGSYEEAEAADCVDAILGAGMGAVLLAQMEHPADFPQHARTRAFRDGVLQVVAAIARLPGAASGPRGPS